MGEPAGPAASIPPVRGRVHAAVDVGSNSVHLLVASVLDGRLEAVLDDRSVFLGLGAAAGGWRFGEALRAALLADLFAYGDLARSLGAETVTFIGAEPLRRAADAGRVVRELERAGWPLHVVGYEEEALLTLIGATGGRRVDVETAVIDIGGGSSELALVGPGRPAVAMGVMVGSGDLTRALVHHDPPRLDELAAVRGRAGELFGAIQSPPVREVIAVGGTASNVAKVAAAAGGTPSPDGWPPTLAESVSRLSSELIDRAIEALLDAPAATTAERFLLNPIRAAVLPAGAAILQAILDRFGVEALSATDAGHREGTVLAVARAGRGWRDVLPVLAEGWDGEGPIGQGAGSG